MDKLAKIKLVLYCSIVFFLTVSIYLISWTILDINDIQRTVKAEKTNKITIKEYGFEKDVLILFMGTITCVFLSGLVAVYTKSICMLLFYSTTGSGMFILLLLILYVESVVSIPVVIILTITNLSIALLATYYAFYDSINYKSMMDKPHTINLIS